MARKEEACRQKSMRTMKDKGTITIDFTSNGWKGATPCAEEKGRLFNAKCKINPAIRKSIGIP